MQSSELGRLAAKCPEDASRLEAPSLQPVYTLCAMAKRGQPSRGAHPAAISHTLCATGLDAPAFAWRSRAPLGSQGVPACGKVGQPASEGESAHRLKEAGYADKQRQQAVTTSETSGVELLVRSTDSAKGR